MINGKTLSIAIFDSNTLAAIGLKSLLKTMTPGIQIDIFGSVEDFERTVSQQPLAKFYIHYFAVISIVDSNIDFFLSRQNKTILMSDNAEYSSSLCGRFHSLCVTGDEKCLINSIKKMMHSYHIAGRHEPSELSSREMEVLTLIVKGYLNKEIADMLNLSLSTVITHRRNITEKLKRKSVGALTIYAVTHGLVDMHEI